MLRISKAGAGLALLLALAGTAAAEEKTEEKAQVEYVVSRKVFKRLTDIQQLIDKKQYTQAVKELDSLKSSKLNPYEAALTWQLLGYVYAGLEKTDQAIQALENCLAQNALPAGAALDVQFNLGQVYLVAGKYDKAASTLLDWIGKVQNPRPDSKYMLAMALMQAGKAQSALDWVKTAISENPRPPESWYQLKLSIEYHLKLYGEAVGTLETLVSKFPSKTYWLQLAAVFSELKQEEKSLAVLELAYQQGLLDTRSEVMNLISLYDYKGIPVKAAALMEEAMEKGLLEKSAKLYRQLGETWLRARELQKAAAAYEKAAAAEKDGKLYLQLAQIHIERQAWEEAIKALRAALDKGGLENPGDAHLLMGVCYFYSRNFAKARAAFEKARDFKATQKNAEQWLQMVDNKLKTTS